MGGVEMEMGAGAATGGTVAAEEATLPVTVGAEGGSEAATEQAQ